MIYPHHLAFMEEAKKAFEENQRLETYRDKDNTYIALRYGLDRNGILIYELACEVAHFAEVMEKGLDLIVLPQEPTHPKENVNSYYLDHLKRYEKFIEMAEVVFGICQIHSSSIEINNEPLFEHSYTQSKFENLTFSVTYIPKKINE